MSAVRPLLAIAALMLLSAPAMAQTPSVTGKVTVLITVDGITQSPTTITFPLTAVGATSAPKTILFNSVSGGQRIGLVLVTGPFRLVKNHCQTNPDGPDWSGTFAPNSSCDLLVVFEPITAVAGVGSVSIHPMPALSTTFAVEDRVRVKEPTGAWVRTAGSPDGTVIGTQATGTFGKIMGTPVTIDNGDVWWWPVSYVAGLYGWTREADLAPVPVCRWVFSYTPNVPGEAPLFTEHEWPMGGYDVTVDIVEGTSSRRVGAMTVACP